MRVACAQLDVAFGQPVVNAEDAIQTLRDLADKGVDLVVFPEAYLTGYCVESTATALEIAIEETHPAIQSIEAVARELGIMAVVGFAEVRAGKVFNSAAIILPDRTAIYRKTHLPELGLDKFVGAGDSLEVYDTPKGRIGVAICFDLRIPEVCRVLALKGTDLIVLPTNWPDGAVFAPTHIAPVRAAENRVFVATCNRVGTENGFGFIGLSGIFAPSGEALVRALEMPEIIIADLDLSQAQTKRNIMVPGKYETDVFGSRRPELYGPLTDPLP